MVFSFCLFAVACSNKQLYQHVQKHNERECLKHITVNYESCRQAANKQSYEEYEKQRKQQINDK